MFLSPILLFSQPEYEEGYVVLNSGDTLRGLVKDRKQPPFGKLYKKVRFRSEGSFTKKYSPLQIKAYKQGENVYESLWIEVEREFLTEYHRSVTGFGKKSFMKVIVKGHLTYYHWEYEDAESGHVDYVPLYKREKESTMMRASQGIFGLKKKRLAFYFRDYPELVKKIENKEIKSPVDVAIMYNQWKEANL